MIFKILLLVFLFSCATNKKITQVDNQIEMVKQDQQGAVLLVRLQTNSQIRRGKSCYLVLDSQGEKVSLKLSEGAHPYGIEKSYANFSLVELNCGPFYYYKFKEKIIAKYSQEHRVVYLGDIDFELMPKGKLDWGRDRFSNSLFKEQAQEIGLDLEQIKIEPLIL